MSISGETCNPNNSISSPVFTTTIRFFSLTCLANPVSNFAAPIPPARDVIMNFARWCITHLFFMKVLFEKKRVHALQLVFFFLRNPVLFCCALCVDNAFFLENRRFALVSLYGFLQNRKNIRSVGTRN